MMKQKDIQEIEKVDFDLIENFVVAVREIWKKRLLVILVSIIGAFMGIIYVAVSDNSVRYTAKATIFSATYGSSEDTYNGAFAMNSYTDLIGSTRVCERAASILTGSGITDVELEKMADNGELYLGAKASKNSKTYAYQMYVIAVTDKDAKSVLISNAVASAFATELNDLLGKSVVQVMDEAQASSRFDTLNAKKLLLIFCAVAFLLVCFVIFVITFFSPKVKSVAQCEADDNYVLGILPYNK